MTVSPSLKKKLLVAAAAAVVIALAWWGWTKFADSGPGEGFVSGNGRIEATEIDIATKLPGRIEDILVREGDFVSAGQPLARMQLETLEAQRDEALAMRQQAEHSVTAAQARVALREADVTAAQALVGQRESELDAAQRRLKRSQTLSQEGAASIQELDDDRARVRGAQATLAASKAQVAAARAAVEAAKAQLVGAQSSVHAATASINRIEADIRDSELRAPRELFEETGLRAEDYEFRDLMHSTEYEIFPEWRYRYAQGVTQNTEYQFALCVPDTTVDVQLAQTEHTEYQWLPASEAADACFSWNNAGAIRRLAGID